MTWMKISPELFDQAAADDLSQDAALAHLQGLAWIYRTERDDCLIPRRLLPRLMPMTDDPVAAAAELVHAGYWIEGVKAFEVLHHADVVRSSLVAQRSKREKDKRAQARARDRRASTDDAAADSSDESAPTQSTNQTTQQPAMRERSGPSPQRALGKCQACGHREPLDDSGRCDNCTAWGVSIDDRRAAS